MFLSIPPENVRKLWFSDVFSGYRNSILAWKGLIHFIALASLYTPWEQRDQWHEMVLSRFRYICLSEFLLFRSQLPNKMYGIVSWFFNFFFLPSKYQLNCYFCVCLKSITLCNYLSPFSYCASQPHFYRITSGFVA